MSHSLVPSRSRIAFVFALTAALSASAFAATVSKVSDDAFEPLRKRGAARKVVLDKLPIYDGKRSVIELEEFQVWAPDGKVVIHGDNGEVMETITPAKTRHFRGLVNNDPESFAYFSIAADGVNVEGLIVTRDRKFSVASQKRAPKAVEQKGLVDAQSLDTFLTQFDDSDAAVYGSGEPWTCAVDKMKVSTGSSRLRATGQNGQPIVSQGVTGTQSYSITIAIETDNEFYVNAGSNATTATNYVTNLVGALSTIYNRDLRTNVVLGAVNLYTSASDPWAAATASAGLSELGNYYHSASRPLGRTTSAVAMLSGKAVPSGIAWEGLICFPDGPDGGGSFYGAYSWNGGIGNLFGSNFLGTIPDPNGINGGTLYGMPSGIQNYWPLAQLSHELGHNMGGHHTHCIAISAGEAATTNHPTQHFVDTCQPGENDGSPCATGSGAPLEKGTIMSYCHNVFASGVPQSRFIFGLATEVSNHQLTDFMLRVGGPLPANGGPLNIVNGVDTFTISAITSPATVAPSSAGNVASITSAGATAFAWEITNGTIVGSATGSSITFTAGASGSVTLRASAYNSTRCGVTDTKAVTIGAAIPAPTNVVATATSTTNVDLTWTAAAGATSYRVYRSTNGTVFTLAGSPSGTSFSDGGRTANTSYLYYVRSFNGATESGDSNRDIATTVIFTDPTITVGVTTMKAAHITQLRTAVNAVRVLTVLGAAVFTSDPTITVASTTGKRLHIIQLRTAIDAARTALGLTAVTYTDPTITVGSTLIKRLHIVDLRGAVQ